MAAYLVVVKYARWFQKDKAQPVKIVEADFFSGRTLTRVSKHR
jgi:hypothetical protein